MKQQITLEQYAELSGKQREFILSWSEKYECDFLLPIGQMIAYLKTQQFTVQRH